MPQENNIKYTECSHDSFRVVTRLPSAHPENRGSNSARVRDCLYCRAATPILGATGPPGSSVGDKPDGV